MILPLASVFRYSSSDDLFLLFAAVLATPPIRSDVFLNGSLQTKVLAVAVAMYANVFTFPGEFCDGSRCD